MQNAVNWLVNSAQITQASLDVRARHFALKHRNRLIKHNEAWAKKLLKFLSYVNQSDWLAKQLVKAISLIDEPQDDSKHLDAFIKSAETDFVKQNAARAKKWGRVFQTKTWE